MKIKSYRRYISKTKHLPNQNALVEFFFTVNFASDSIIVIRKLSESCIVNIYNFYKAYSKQIVTVCICEYLITMHHFRSNI